MIRVVPRSRSAVARRIDVAGQLLVSGFLATLTYALIEAPRFGFGSVRIVAVAALALAMFVAFVVVELRIDEPLIDLGFFRDRQFAGAIFLCAGMFFTYGGFIYFNALYLQDVRGYSALAAGFLTLPAAVPALAGGPISGWIVGTRGPRGVLAGGMLVLALGVGSLAFLAEDAAIGWLLAAYLVVGIGYAVLSAPVNTVAVASMPRDQAGVAAGVASSARNIGIVLGIAVLGAIVNGRVPVVLTPASGVSDAALAVFRDAYVDALHIAYIVARGSRSRRRARGRADDAADAARAAAEELHTPRRTFAGFPTRESASDMLRDDFEWSESDAAADGLIVRIAGEGRWLLPGAARDGLRLLDNAVTRAVDDVREDEYERLLAGLCAFVRLQGEVLEEVVQAGEADVTVPPPDLPLAGAVDALFDGGVLGAAPPAVRAR